ncbi:bifunctional nuclease family protein, partial [Acinetobacter baumannii]|nr:bifunctional nuclease family protein [Acinetobacter baumannii]
MGSNMREVDVVGVRFEEPEYTPVLILHEKDGGRYVPIWIGAAEAAAISLKQQGVEPSRPLTHD